MKTWLTKWKRPIIMTCILAVVGGIVWFFPSKVLLGPTKVTIAKAHKENIKPSVFGIGTVEAKL